MKWHLFVNFTGFGHHLHVVGIASSDYINALVFVRGRNCVHRHSALGVRLLFGRS